jgi:ElaB/YqjD/DUF883 family membrane-anchored ribosome-binding protein
MSIFQRSLPGVGEVELAQSDVDSARRRLMATVEQIQSRLAPASLVSEALDQMKARSTSLANEAREIVRERPATVAAAAAGVGLLLAAKPIVRLFRRRKPVLHETPAAERRSSHSRRSVKPVSKDRP